VSRFGPCLRQARGPRGRPRPNCGARGVRVAFAFVNSDAIILRGMRFHTLVGLLPHEEKYPQPLELDVAVYLPLRRVGESDSARMLLDYRTLYKAVADIVGTSPHQLLEALCERIATAVLAFDGVERVRVAARKPHAPIPGPLDWVEVVVERSAGDAASNRGR
jgi:dihydroneopterin aldolase